MKKNMMEHLEAFGLNQAFAYLSKDPDTNVPKIVHWLEKFDRDHMLKTQMAAVKEAIADKQGNWYTLVKNFYDEIDPGVIQKVFETFVINATVIGGKHLDANRLKYGCNIPWAILMDPTSACNLHCTGCWAADYGDKLSMDLDTLDSIITQAKQLGTYMYVYSGGEPLVRKKDIITLCEKHPDCAFLAFTNATLIDEAFADDMLRVKNFYPAISVEGFAEQTDSRRGQGTYDAVIRAMEILKRKKLLFGVSCCYTRANTEIIGSEAYIDDIIAKGAKFAWFFTYMPIGVDAVPELMVTPEQREFMYRQIREFRSTKPLFTLDFWNDGEYVKGCIAGGREYMHINAGGDIEPCAFIHYADHNIHSSTLLEAYQGPLFMEYHKGQPFNQNHLRPCPLLDNPQRLAQMVDASGAHSTDLSHPEDVHALCGKCETAARNWAPVADELWDKTLIKKGLKPQTACGACAGCSAQGACAQEEDEHKDEIAGA